MWWPMFFCDDCSPASLCQYTDISIQRGRHMWASRAPTALQMRASLNLNSLTQYANTPCRPNRLPFIEANIEIAIQWLVFRTAEQWHAMRLSVSIANPSVNLRSTRVGSYRPSHLQYGLMNLTESIIAFSQGRNKNLVDPKQVSKPGALFDMVSHHMHILTLHSNSVACISDQHAPLFARKLGM